MGNFGDGASVRREGQALLRAQQCLAAMASYLSGQVTGLIPESWHGPGADTFSAGWSGQGQTMSQLSAVCGHVGQALVDLGNALDAANQQATKAQQLVPGPLAGRGLDPAGEQKSQQMLSQALGAAQQAWNTARSKLAGVTVPKMGPAMTVSQVNAWASRVAPVPQQPKSTPWYDSVWHGIEHGAADVGNFIANNAGQLGEMGVGTGEMVGGGLLALLGAGGEVGGGALDLTGIGAVVGVPANVVSAAAIGAGLTGVVAGARTFGTGASQLNMSSDSGGGGGGGEPASGGSSVDETLSSLRSGRTPPNLEVDNAGDLEQVWQKLGGGSGTPVEGSTYPGQLEQLPDGTRIGMRSGSKSGGPTIDVWRPGKPYVKVHLPSG